MLFVVDYGLKKKKRKMGVSLPGGISVSQILAQREKLAMEQQAFNKEIVANPQQVSISEEFQYSFYS